MPATRGTFSLSAQHYIIIFNSHSSPGRQAVTCILQIYKRAFQSARDAEAQRWIHWVTCLKSHSESVAEMPTQLWLPDSLGHCCSSGWLWELRLGLVSIQTAAFPFSSPLSPAKDVPHFFLVPTFGTSYFLMKHAWSHSRFTPPCPSPSSSLPFWPSEPP